MLSKPKQLKNNRSGFTIIEVMIVLAIAGLIMVIVFLAVPQLQRNQRNTRRKDVTNRIKAELENFSSNNNGSYPAASTAAGAGNFGQASQAGTFAERYFNGIDVNDPQSGTSVLVASGANPFLRVGTGAGATLGPNPGNITYATSAICNGEALAAGQARDFAAIIRLEGGSYYCVDNR